MKQASVFWGAALVVLGILFLLQTQGIIGNVWPYVFPVGLILVGGWIVLGIFWKPAHGVDETFSVSLQSAKNVRYKFAHGAGQIEIRGGAPMGQALVGSSGVGMNYRSRLSGDQLEVEVDAGPSIIPFIGPSSGVWQYQLTQEVPVALKIDTGASRLIVDLKDVPATRIDLQTGASATEMTMPARGASYLDVEAGAASINIRVPESTAGRIRMKEGVTALNVDTNRFPQTSSGFYQSPNYDSAQDRAEISIEAGMGSITIK